MFEIKLQRRVQLERLIKSSQEIAAKNHTLWTLTFRGGKHPAARTPIGGSKIGPECVRQRNVVAFILGIISLPLSLSFSL